MAERAFCQWTENDIAEPVCHFCKGWVVIDNAKMCPFTTGGAPKPEYQHLITADERFASIRLMKAMEVVEERKKNRGSTHGKKA